MDKSDSLISPPFGPPDVIWTKYEGVVPEGAITCGLLNLKQVYAGRFVYNNEVLIGTADLDAGKCMVARNGAVHESSNFEVMSVPVGDPLQWEVVNPDSTLSRRLLVKAGKLSDNTIIYVGRFRDGEDTYIGWANKETRQGYFPQSNNEIILTDFEILIHRHLEFMCICPPCPPR